MAFFKLCLILPFVVGLIASSAGQLRKINGENVFELPIYRTKHPAQALLEFAGAKGFSAIQKLNQSESLQTIFRKLKLPSTGVKNETIAIFKSFDADFYTTVGIGKPAQKINLLVDTSWTDSWVISSNCSEWICVNKSKYDSEKSHVHHFDGRTFKVDLGKGPFGGSLEGNLTIDTVVFAHDNATNVTFGAVGTMPWFIFFTRYDGILAMAKNHGPVDAPMIWRELARQNKIKNNVFSLYFNRDPTIPRAGSVLIGAVDPHHYNGSASAEVSVTSDLFWEFKIKDLIFSRIKKKGKRHALLTFCENSCYAKISSGGNSIIGPTDAIDKIHQLIGAQPFFFGFKRVPCEKIAKLPELVFTFGKKELVLYGEHYIQQIFYNGYALCLSTFVSSNSAEPNWSFGIPLLSKYYTIFNLDKNTVKITDYKTTNKTNIYFQ